MTNLTVEIMSTVYNKKGKVVGINPWKKTCCLLQSFMRVFYAQAANVILLVKDTSGVDKTTNSWGTSGTFVADLNDTTLGVVVGSGQTIVAMTDYKLENQITTGIQHQAQTISYDDLILNSRKTLISRSFLNNTGAVLQIKEVGLYGYGEGPFDKFCYDRTLYPVNVPVAGTIELTYKFEITL